MVLLQKPWLNQGYCSKTMVHFVVTMVLLQKKNIVKPWLLQKNYYYFWLFFCKGPS